MVGGGSRRQMWEFLIFSVIEVMPISTLSAPHGMDFWSKPPCTGEVLLACNVRNQACFCHCMETCRFSSPAHDKSFLCHIFLDRGSEKFHVATNVTLHHQFYHQECHSCPVSQPHPTWLCCDIHHDRGGRGVQIGIFWDISNANVRFAEFSASNLSTCRPMGVDSHPPWTGGGWSLERQT